MFDTQSSLPPIFDAMKAAMPQLSVVVEKAELSEDGGVKRAAEGGARKGMFGAVEVIEKLRDKFEEESKKGMEAAPEF